MDLNLRDYFAAKAMLGFIVRGGFEGQGEFLAEIAYERADAMLKERKK